MGVSHVDDTPGLPAHLAGAALRAVLDGLPAMVGYWDRDLRNRLANTGYTEFFGLTPDEILGMDMRELLGPELFAHNAPYIEAVLTGERQEFDRTLTDVDGGTRHVHATYVPDFVEGEVAGFFVLITEVTERVEAERAGAEETERYRALIRSLPAGFALLFDAELRYTVADGEALAAFGFSREDLEGRTVVEALPAEFAAELEPRYLRALAGQPTTWERSIDRRIYSLTAGPVRREDGEITGGIVVCADVTQERLGATIARALTAISSVAAEGATLDELAQQVVRTLREIFDLDNVGLMRVREGRWAKAIAADPSTDEIDPELAAEFDLEDASMALSESVRTERPALHRYTASCRGAVARRLYENGLRAGAAAPIFIRGELWGALSMTARDPEALDQALMDRLESVAELVGMAISNVEAWEALRTEATTDPITGLANHRAFHERLAQGLGEARRDGRHCGLIMLDLDWFKAVNDTHGHPVGDDVLREVGRRLRDVARSHELAARIGGEEFALVVGGTDLDGAMAAAERARRAIADEPFPVVGKLTASAGVAVASGAGAPVASDELIDAADRALYAAKHAGRDRVVGPGGQQTAGGRARSRRRR